MAALLRILVYYISIASLAMFVRSIGKEIGPGFWTVHNIMKCPDDQYKNKYDVTRKKMNRTHDGFDAWVELQDVIDETIGMRIDICKFVDGGCKLYQVLSDNNVCAFIKKYAENNFRKILIAGGVDPPDCPLQPGSYEVKNYMFDYSELPVNGIYGLFGVKAYMVENMVETSCVDLTVEFKEKEDGDEDCDDD